LIKLIIFGSLVAIWILLVSLTTLPFGYNVKMEQKKRDAEARKQRELDEIEDYWEDDELGRFERKIEREMVEYEKATKK
jgi:hypothetical protein